MSIKLSGKAGQKLQASPAAMEWLGTIGFQTVCVCKCKVCSARQKLQDSPAAMEWLGTIGSQTGCVCVCV